MQQNNFYFFLSFCLLAFYESRFSLNHFFNPFLSVAGIFICSEIFSLVFPICPIHVFLGLPPSFLFINLSGYSVRVDSDNMSIPVQMPFFSILFIIGSWSTISLMHILFFQLFTEDVSFPSLLFCFYIFFG